MPRRLQNVPLSVEEILSWADFCHRSTGHRPKTNTGPVQGGPLGTTWRQVDNALRYGLRGLEGGSSLAQLLADQRGVRNVQALPALTEGQIVAWAKLHRQHTGSLPTENSGAVRDAPGEDWKAIDMALRVGHCGLPGNDSLAKLLARHLGVRNRMDLPPLTEAIILAWIDRHHTEFGHWPKCAGGVIVGAEGETWRGVDDALRKGLRGLPGGSSLAKLLAEKRGARNMASPPALTPDTIRQWARWHLQRTGRLPTADSGPVVDANGETWKGINLALRQGLRELPADRA